MMSRFSRLARSNFKNISVVFFVLIALFAFTACEEPKVEQQLPPSYKTPTIVGSVTIPEGFDVSPADLEIKVVSEGLTKKISKVNPDGTFAITDLEADKHYDLYFSSVKQDVTNFKAITDKKEEGTLLEGIGVMLEDIIGALESGTDLGNLLMKPLGTIKGTVTKKGETEHYDILVSIPGTSFTAVTDEKGNFSMYNVPQGSYKVRFKADDYLPYMVEEVVVTSGEEALKHPVKTLKPVELVKEVGSVEGSVRVSDMDSYAGVSVSLVSSSGARITVTTPSSGIFRFEDVKPGTYHVEAYIPDYRTISSGEFNVVSGQLYQIPEKLELFTRISTVTGSVGLSGSDIKEGISILLQDINDPGRSYSAITDVDGRFTKLVMPGTYKLTASYAGYTSQSIEAEAIIDTVIPVRFPILLPSTGGISGRIVLEGLVDMSGSTVTIKSIDGSYTDSKPVDNEGRFLFSGLNKVGSYYLYAAHDGYVTSGEKLAEVSLGSITSVEDIVLKSVESPVRGVVELDGTESFTGIQIMLTDGKRQYDATTSQAGEYLFPAVMPGTYTMYVSMAGYESRTVEGITIEPSNPKQLDSMKLPIAVKSVTGKVQLELRTDYSGALVTATNTSNEQLVYSAITNSNGTFTLAGMVAGNYNIVISMPAYNTVSLPTLTVDGIAMESIQDVIVLPIARGTITGVATLEGWTNHEGITVELMKGTEVYDTATTSSSGAYSFYVPEGNYSGVRLSKVDFADTEVSKLIAIFAGDAASVGNAELKATHVAIEGYVNVAGTDDNSMVLVNIEGLEAVAETTSEGYYSFKHVPLTRSSYNLYFTREYAPKFRQKVNVEPSPVISVPLVEMEPQSTSISGVVKLDGMYDYSGITVTATSCDSLQKEITGKSEPNGSFYLSNLITTSEYDVVFSKPGWDSQRIHVNGLVPLVEKDITAGTPVVLVDTTLPVLNGVTINNGAPSTSKLEVAINVDAFEEGSGIDVMKITWLDNFDRSEWQPYHSVFTTEITDKLNGPKTFKIMVRDSAGNVAVSVATADITLSDQIRTVEGVLETEEDLHWTAKNNPYVVSGDILVPDGKMLVIDPGVDVLFNGPYSILVRGNIKAVGTDLKPIYFRSSKNDMPEGLVGYHGDWGGINIQNESLEVNRNGYSFEYVAGNTMQHCMIEDISMGVSGYCFMNYCVVTSDNYAIGNEKALIGYLLNSVITGNFRMKNIERANGYSPSVAMNNTFVGNGTYQASFFFDDVMIVNNKISGYRISFDIDYAESRVMNNTVTDCVWSSGYNSQKVIRYNEFVNLKESLSCCSSSNGDNLEFNNFVDIRIPVLVSVQDTSNRLFNYRHNYWGNAFTNELDSLVLAGRRNASFIYDINDRFTLSEVDWSGYAHKPWSFAGYKGDAFMDVEIEYPRPAYEVPVGNSVYFRIKSLTNEICDYRVATDLDELMAKAWTSYSMRGCIDSSEIDLSKVNANGYLELLIQGRDVDGNETPIVNLEVPYRAPIINNVGIDENAVIEGDEEFYLGNRTSYNSPYGNISTTWTVDGIDNNYITSTSLKNGEHIVGLMVTDNVGQTAYKEVSFEVRRPVPEVSLFQIEKNSLGLGESLVFDLDLVNTKHLKSVNIYAGDNLIRGYSYPSSENSKANISLHGTAQAVYLPSGINDLYVEIEDYAGNINRRSVGSVTIEGVDIAPVISGLTFDNGHVFDGYEPFDTGMIFQDDGGVRIIEVYANDKCLYSVNNPTYSKTLETIKPSVKIPLAYLSNGDYVLNVRAVDFAGNESSINRNFSIHKPPMVISCELTDEGSYYYVNGNVQNASYLREVRVLVDGVVCKTSNPYQQNGSDTYGCYMNIYKNTLPYGQHELKIEVIDQAGNCYESDPYMIDILGEAESEYGTGITWNDNGSLLADDYTRFLMGFEDPAAVGFEEVSGSDYCSSRPIYDNDAVGNGGVNNAYIYLGEDIIFYDRVWTIEFWHKNTNMYSDWNNILNCENLMNLSHYLWGDNQNVGFHYSLKYHQYADPEKLMTSEEFMGVNSREFYEQWHHYAVVSDGTGFKIYLDGVLYVALPDKISSDRLTSMNTCSEYNSYYDEIRISDKARSQNELFDYVQYVKKLKNW